MASKIDTDTIPWVEKYRPEHLVDFVGNREAVKKLENWLKTWNQQKKKVVLLAGPAGVGKTSVVYYLIKKYKYEFVEVNASDKRNKKAVELFVGKSSTEGTVLQGARVKKLILVDEADGLFGNEDRGGGGALGKAVVSTRTPIVCTANDPTAKALKAAKKHMLVIEFKSLSEDEILLLLEKIAEKEKVKVKEEILIEIAKNCGGDARSAINDLEGVSFGVIKGVKIIFSPRNQEKSLDIALNNIFSANDFDSVKTALNGVDVDYRELLAYVYEHAYKQAGSSEELLNMYRIIAEADFYLSMCYIKQDWKFLKYFFTLISSVGLVKSSPFKYTKYGFPSYWALMGRLRGKNASITNIAEKSIKYLHCSKKAFQTDFLPFIRIIFNTDPKIAGGLAAWFQYTDEDINFLTGNSSKLLKQIKTHSEEAYLQFADKWMEKAKKMTPSLLFYNQPSKKKPSKPKTKSKPKKSVVKEEKSTSSEKKKAIEKPSTTEEKPQEEKKTERKPAKKKSSQISLEKFIDK